MVDQVEKSPDNEMILNYMYYLDKYFEIKNTRYLIMPNAALFYVNEARPRPFVYGVNNNNKVVAVLFHTLF